VEPGSFGDVFTQGLTIVGWVSLWRPVEIFLYEWWPLWRDVRLYDYILHMDIVLQPREQQLKRESVPDNTSGAVRDLTLEISSVSPLIT
jgi:hypothetical protein